MSVGQAKSILIIAGEVSGDMHAGQLVRAMKTRVPELRFFGVGGPEMRAAGVETLYDIKDTAVTGFVEVLKRFWFFRRMFYDMLATARARKPDAVILVDYPGFNLPFAAKVRRLGIKVIYYICPQVWAWHRERIPRMAKIVDRLVTIFPFEAPYFEGAGLKVDFAGHPLVDEARKALAEPVAKLPWKGAPGIALLPGSRANEIEHILPSMWAAAGLVERKHPQASFLIAAPSAKVEELLRHHIAGLSGGPTRWAIVAGQTRQVLRQARAAMVASGTATIETALMGCPMVVVYRMAAFSFFLAKRLVNVSHIGMVNIVAGKPICPEFVQGAATPEALAEAIEPLFQDGPARARMIEELKKAVTALGPGGASQRAAEIVLGALGVSISENKADG